MNIPGWAVSIFLLLFIGLIMFPLWAPPIFSLVMTFMKKRGGFRYNRFIS